MTDWIDILHTPLSVHIATTFLADPQSGAIDLFIGTTRADKADLLALDYKAYEPMAIGQMRSIAVISREKFGVRKLVMLHRVGRVAVGEMSVLVGVSTPHRHASFEATRFLIEQIKANVTIWKRDVTRTDSGEWSHP